MTADEPTTISEHVKKHAPAAVTSAVVAFAVALAMRPVAPTPTPTPLHTSSLSVRSATTSVEIAPPPVEPKCKVDEGHYASEPANLDGCIVTRINERPYAKIQCEGHTDGVEVTGGAGRDVRRIVPCDLAKDN
jgi:hypothetical protein